MMATKSELTKQSNKKQAEYDKLIVDLGKLKALNQPIDKVVDAIRNVEKEIRELDAQLLTAKD